MSEAACPKCNSAERIPGARVVDHAHGTSLTVPLGVSVQAFPPHLFFSGEVEHQVSAHVCGKCGYIELYAEKPQELLAKARKFMQSEKNQK